MSEAHDGAAEAVTEDTAAAETDAGDEAQAQGDEPSGDDAAAEGDEGDDGEQPRRKQTVQERINEKTRLQKDAERRAEKAERDAEHWRDQALRNQPAQEAQQQRREATPPDPNDYEHGSLDVAFIADNATFHAERAFEKRQKEAEAANEARRQRSEFDARVQATVAQKPDFFDVVGQDYSRVNALVSNEMGITISILEDGPSLAYHLAQNPAEARRIAALHPLAQAAELGKLSHRLASPPAPTAKTATDAPAPTTVVRGAGGQYGARGDTTDFAAFEKLADAKR